MPKVNRYSLLQHQREREFHGRFICSTAAFVFARFFIFDSKHFHLSERIKREDFLEILLHEECFRENLLIL